MKRRCLLMLVLFSLPGCSLKSEAENKAIWLCLNSHWSSPDIDQFPDDHAPSMYLSASDLAFLKEHRRPDPLTQFIGVVGQVDVIGSGIRQALADRSECKILAQRFDSAHDTVTIKMQRRVPDVDLDLTVKRYADLATQQSADRVASKVKTLIDAQKPPMLTQTKEMLFIRERERWVLSLGLQALYEAELIRKAAKEAERARIQEEMSRQERDKDALVREYDEQLALATTFENVSVKLVQIKLLPPEPSSPDKAILSFEVYTSNKNEGRYVRISDHTRVYQAPVRFARAKLTVGFKSKDGAPLWEQVVESSSLKVYGEDAFNVKVTVDKGFALPDGAQSYAIIEELSHGERVYSKVTSARDRLAAQAIKEKIAQLDAALDKARKQLE